MFNKNKTDLANSMITNLKKSLPQLSNYRTGSVIRTIVEIVALALETFYHELHNILPNLFTHSATGHWLDEHSLQLGISRIPAQKTQGKLILSRTSSNYNLTIPKNKIFSTHLDTKGQRFRFKNIEETIFLKGYKEMQILIEAEEAGSCYNVGEHAITEFITPINGVDFITNPPHWITTLGLDIESDEALKNRCLAQWKSISGANKDAYISWAKTVPGVETAVVIPTPREYGTVDIFVLGINNISLSPEIIQQVQTKIDENKPIGTDATVKSPSEVPINLCINIQTIPSHQVTKSLIKEKIKEKIYEFFKEISLGYDFESSELIATLFELDAIKSVYISQPQSVQISPLEIARLGTLSINIS